MALFVVGILVVLLVVSSRAPETSGEGEVSSPYVDEVVVSGEDVSYPQRDVLTFEGRPREIYIYVSMSDFPEGARATATVERRGSLYARLFGGGSLRVEEVGGGLTPVGRGSEAVSGVLKLRVRHETGDRFSRLPAGNYSVGVLLDGRVGASKRFVVSGS